MLTPPFEYEVLRCFGAKHARAWALRPHSDLSTLLLVFRGVRPNLVVDESSVDNALPQNLQTEFALSQVAGTTVEMSNKFVDQFVFIVC